MIRAVAIETSGRQGSIALAEDDKTVAERQFPHGLQHAAQIIPIIDELCDGRGWTPGDLRRLYVSIGPGSFTGLRIAVTVAKTLSLATGALIVAVPTVKVLAENAPEQAEHLAIVLDAKRGQIYTADFHRRTGQWTQTQPARLARLADVLGASDRPLYLLGEGIPYHRQYIPVDAQIIVTDEASWLGRASVVAKLGFQMASAGEFADPDSLSPLYIRPPEAEERLATGP